MASRSNDFSTRPQGWRRSSSTNRVYGGCRRERRLRRVSQFVGPVPAGTSPSRYVGRGVPSKGTALAKRGGCLPTGREMGIVPLANATIRIMAAQGGFDVAGYSSPHHPHPYPSGPPGRTAPTVAPGPSAAVGVVLIAVPMLSPLGQSSSDAYPVFVRPRADPLPNQELTMAMLDDVLGAAGPGAKNRTWALRRRRRGKLGMSIGRFATAALICAGAALMMSGAADAKASRASRASKASAPPALDAQAVNAAELSAPSGKGRAPAPSAAALIKAEILLDRADFSPGQSTARAGRTIKRLSPRFRTQTESSRAAISTRKPGSA